MALFRFRQRQVIDPLAQENFEQLEGELPKSWLQLAVPLAAGRKVAFGSGTVTFTASSLSAITPVTHGLGKAPLIAGAFTQGATIFQAWYGCQNYTTTTFDVYGNTPANVTGGGSFVWVAVA